MGLGITHAHIQLIAFAFAFEVFTMIRNFALILFILSVFIIYSLIMYEGGRLTGLAEAAFAFELMSE